MQLIKFNHGVFTPAFSESDFAVQFYKILKILCKKTNIVVLTFLNFFPPKAINLNALAAKSDFKI
jgi:hypothetical protein